MRRAQTRTDGRLPAAPAAAKKPRGRALARLAALLFVLALTVAASQAAVPARAAAAGVDDWVHLWEVVQLVNDRPPTGVAVYYLGDSTSRESTVSDAAWTAQLRQRSGRDVQGFTLGGHNQTFGMDMSLLKGLPDGPSGSIVLIGVGLSRFIGPPTSKPPARIALPSPVTLPLSPWDQHHYDNRPVLSQARKKELVPRWMVRRYSGFKANRTANLAAIGRLIVKCRQKHLRPVLIDLPLNMAIVGHGLDTPRSSYRKGCKALAAKYGVKYLAFQRDIGLPSSGYYDICHLVRSGYLRWQRRLTRELVSLLPAQ